MRLDQMYQEVILDHYKNPHGKGLVEPFDSQVHHVNPTCGDEITLRVKLSGAAGSQVVESSVLRQPGMFDFASICERAARSG